jgi:hypothetical protein
MVIRNRCLVLCLLGLLAAPLAAEEPVPRFGLETGLPGADFRGTGRRVRDLTGGLQIPTSAKPANVPDFPLAVVRKAGKP